MIRRKKIITEEVEDLIVVALLYNVTFSYHYDCSVLLS